MNLPKLSINRPVTITMFFLGIVLLGFISWGRLPQELFPPINYPQITVMTSYEGAAPEEIETLITKIIEEATGTVNNVKRISSTSKEGLSLVMVEFNWGTNMDFASLSVREKIDLIKERLPRDAKEPIVVKYNPFDLPVMTISVTSPTRAPLELRHICKKVIKDELEKIEGVASVEITGGLEREILVEVDQPRLMASGLSILEVVNSLKMANLNYPAGTIKESFYEYLIRTIGEFQTVGEIKDIATAVEEPERESEEAQTREEQEKLKNKPKRLVYLRDIARIKDTTKERDSISRYNGKENISLSVRKQSGANTVLVADSIRKAIPKLKQGLADVGVEIVYDQSKFIRSSISSVTNAAVQGGILSFLVLFFFLKSISASLIITSAIPISIAAVFSLMLLTGVSINVISLGGLALGVGMVVDNANVVLEAIFLKGGSKKEAALEGTNEVVNAITGSTLTTIAVFLPTIFVIGIAGQLFKELAFTITFSLIVSLVMAVSLVPVFASFSRPSAAGGKKILATRMMEWFRLEENLPFFFKHRLALSGVITAIFLISCFLLFSVDREFLPRIDQRQFILKVEKSPGTPLKNTDEVVRDIEKALFNIPEVKEVTVNIGSSKDRPAEEALETLGSHQAQILVNLKSKKEMKSGYARSTNEVVQYLKKVLAPKELQEKMVIEYIAQESFLKTAFGEQAPIVLEVKSTDLDRVSLVSEELKQGLEGINGLYGVKTSLVLPSPETKVNIIKDRASLYNLSVRDIAMTTQVAIKGYVSTKFKERKEGEEVDIRVRLRESDRSDFTNLRNILIYSQLRNLQVALSEVAYLTRGRGPTQIKRLDQQRAASISANVSQQRSFNRARRDVDILINRIGKRFPDTRISSGGQAQAMKESFNSLRFALILSLVLVYMIMAGQFESLWQPFVIMFTLPLSIIGVAVALILTRTPISAVALLGMIMLGGIVVNNGIVLIDYANLLIRQQGLSTKDALAQASARRLRPILMTSLTTILGLLPLGLGIGEGSELMAPLAITVMGGLTSSTFLTLFVIPIIYLMFEQLISHPVFARFRRMEEEMLPAPAAPVEAAKTEPQVFLNERQSKLLELIKEKGRITRSEYTEIFDVSVPTAARDLKELMSRGYLIAKGPLGPGRFYILKQ